MQPGVSEVLEGFGNVYFGGKPTLGLYSTALFTDELTWIR
jgi:hypothetical protein